ncbi:MAG TPA: CbtA family protein [Stellaceae bacterium]|nr:CbtA family protein [Stellaceae bacterium]
MFRRVFLAAILAGLAAGLLVTALQTAKLSPLIAAAEVYETAAMPSTAHEDAAWEPAAGVERIGFTLLANILIAIGFGLLLSGGFALRQLVSGAGIDASQGLLWGLAGFAAFALAPSLGLPPTLPGSAEADLLARQSWWIGTALATSAGIALIVFALRWWSRALGALAILLPHVVGAPRAPLGGATPATLAAEFATASLVIAALFWIALGSLCGWVYDRLGRRREP